MGAGAALDRFVYLNYTSRPFPFGGAAVYPFTCGRRMNSRMARVLGMAVCAGLLSGCVERRYVITTDPPGAIVLRNGEPIGAAPADDHFVYYGNYHFTVIKEGYQILQVDQEISAPWYEYIPLDFFSENLFPYRVVDVRRFHYRLEPLRTVTTDDPPHRPPSPGPRPPSSPPLAPTASSASFSVCVSFCCSSCAFWDGIGK